jgi:CRP-like cAMP-binding protein
LLRFQGLIGARDISANSK